MIRVLLVFALIALQAEIAMVVWGGNMANQLILQIMSHPAPDWDVFTPQPLEMRDV